MLEAFAALWHSLPLVLQVGFKIAAILFPLLGMVAYYTFAERKVIAYMQLRVGPNRVGPRGWLQPIADAIKLMFKEIIIPTNAERQLFLIAPVLALAPARMLSAHGRAIDDPAAVLNQYLEHRQRREDQIVAALRVGDRRPEAIVDRLYEGLDPRLKRLGQESVLAHLVKLRDEGRARSDGEEWELS